MEAERDGKGRFLPGNAGGPGNPYARRCAELRAGVLAAVTDQELEAIVKKLIDKAKNGDLAATKLIFSYCLGRPDAAMKPDRVDLDGDALNDERERREAVKSEREARRQRAESEREALEREQQRAESKRRKQREWRESRKNRQKVVGIEGGGYEEVSSDER